VTHNKDKKFWRLIFFKIGPVFILLEFMRIHEMAKFLLIVQNRSLSTCDDFMLSFGVHY
jgi:hypothetical protein